MFHSCVQVHHFYIKFLQMHVNIFIWFWEERSVVEDLHHTWKVYNKAMRMLQSISQKFLSHMYLSVVSSKRYLSNASLNLFLTFNSYLVMFSSTLMQNNMWRKIRHSKHITPTSMSDSESYLRELPFRPIPLGETESDLGSTCIWGYTFTERP